MSEAKRRFWGWGLEGQGPNPEQQQGILRSMAGRLGGADLELAPEPRLEDIELRPPRLTPPESLAEICSSSPEDRANRSYGKSYRDVVRAVRGDFPNPPDVVAFPRNEGEVAAVLDWCGDTGAAVIPYGGGSSVVGGIEPDLGVAYPGCVTLDLGRLRGRLCV